MLKNQNHQYRGKWYKLRLIIVMHVQWNLDYLNHVEDLVCSDNEGVLKNKCVFAIGVVSPNFIGT